MNRWLFKAGILAVFGLLSVAPGRVLAVAVDDVAKQLICTCGCTMVLDNCSHQECGPRETMLASIRQRINQGQSETQIVQAFVATYGEKVLAEPPKRGFNLTAWISPFAAIALGGGIIWALLRMWARRGRFVAAEAARKDHGGDDEEYRRRLEQELKDFPERGFR